MNKVDIVLRVKQLIECYPCDRYLYLHRCPMIVRCLNWDITDDAIRVGVSLERLVTGNERINQSWEFYAILDDINLFKLERRMLGGCQLRDTIVLDPSLFEAAKSVHPDSEEGIRSAF